MRDVTPPDGWTSIESEFSQQLSVFQRRRDGLVVSIEEDVTSDKYAVSFLPQNFQEDNQVIRSYGDNGYLYSGNSLDEAIDEAVNWMEENPR